METLPFYNNTAIINEIWYDSHRNLIVKIATELDSVDQIDSLAEKFLGKAMKMKKFKDPKKPKRPKTSYLYFCEEKRPLVKSNHPEFKVGQIMKELGKMWQSLSEDNKFKYIELYKKDKIRYEDELEEYQ